MSETAQGRWGPGAPRRGEQPAAVFTIGAAGSGSEPLARALAALRDCSALGEEPAPVADLIADGDRREGTAGRAGARAIRSREHVTTVVDGAPRRALQIPRLDEVYEAARFILVHRPAAEAAAVALAGWRSGRHVTHPDLPGWEGPAWSYALIPGWRRLADAGLGAIVAEQWAVTTRIALEDLARLLPDSWTATSYEELAADSEATLGRLAAETGLNPTGAEAAARGLVTDLARIPTSPGPPPAGLDQAVARLEDGEAEAQRLLRALGLTV